MSVSSSDDPSLNGLVGLAPGAETSAIVGEKIMSQLLAERRDIRLVTYADNVFVLGREAEAVVSCLEHLRNTAERLATGSLRLRDGGVVPLTGTSGVSQLPAQFAFLHHVGEVREHNDGAHPAHRVTWSPDQRKLDEYSLADNGTTINAETIDKIERKVSQWRKAYPSWPAGDIWEMRYLAELAALRFYKDPEPLNKSRAAHALMLCYYAENRERDFFELLPAGQDRVEDRRRNQIMEAALSRLATIRARHSGSHEPVEG